MKETMYYVVIETWEEFKQNCIKSLGSSTPSRLTYVCCKTGNQCSESKCPRIKCSAYNVGELKETL